MTPAEFNHISKIRAELIGKCPYLHEEIGRIDAKLSDGRYSLEDYALAHQHLYDKCIAKLDVGHGYGFDDGERTPNRQAGVEGKSN
jgi:hypothetical protein